MDEAADQSTAHGSDAVQAFLRRVVSSALAGRVASASEDPPTTRPPLSESSQSVVRGLTGPRWSGVEPWLDACKESAREPSAVPSWSRALQPALVAIVCAIFLRWILVIVLNTGWVTNRPLFPADASESNVLLNSLARIERLRTAGTAEADTQRRALEIYAARRFSPIAARPEFGDRLRPFRASAIDIARRHPMVSDADFLSAIRELGDETLDRLNRLDLTLEPCLCFSKGWPCSPIWPSSRWSLRSRSGAD